MSEILPTNEEQMLGIDGITKVIFDKFGKMLLEITCDYHARRLSKSLFIPIFTKAVGEIRIATSLRII